MCVCVCLGLPLLLSSNYTHTHTHTHTQIRYEGIHTWVHTKLSSTYPYAKIRSQKKQWNIKWPVHIGYANRNHYKYQVPYLHIYTHINVSYMYKCIHARTHIYTHGRYLFTALHVNKYRHTHATHKLVCPRTVTVDLDLRLLCCCCSAGYESMKDHKLVEVKSCNPGMTHKNFI